ncbi:MAG: excinuclease ABC subunit UvrA [bacterium]
MVKNTDNKKNNIFEHGVISVKGARVHNLKNINIDIPKHKLVIFTGLSGSGKSSLAFDTIYAEGQRRYVESLSSYARQFLGLMEKPDVDLITGLAPAISIDQKSASHNPRSTVGTVTEIYDYLRLLYARTGHAHCFKCDSVLQSRTIQDIVDEIIALPHSLERRDDSSIKIMILAPLIKSRKGEYEELFSNLSTKGFVRVRVDGMVRNLEEEIKLDKQKKHNIEAVIDRLVLEKKHLYLNLALNGNGSEINPEEVEDFKQFRQRLTDSIETAIRTANSEMYLTYSSTDKKGNEVWEDKYYSESLSCPNHPEISSPALEPNSFSFNAPQGACPVCHGLGSIQEIDEKLVYSPNLTIAEGAIYPWSRSVDADSWHMRFLQGLAVKMGFNLKIKMKDLKPEHLKAILFGSETKVKITMENGKFEGSYESNFEGVIPNLMRRYKETDSDYIKKEIEKYMHKKSCPECLGARLRKESLAVRIGDHNILNVTKMTISDAKDWINELTTSETLSENEKKIAIQVVKEISARLNFLLAVGLDYLTLSRTARTLSGGEAQRIRLASQIGSGLTGVLYVLDEPSIGLHQRDNDKLIETLKHLRDLGNSVVVVEHDEDTMEASDYIIDMGPGAGEHGGQIISSGNFNEILHDENSITGKYLSHKLTVGEEYNNLKNNNKIVEKGVIKIIGATEHNLKKINVEIPLGNFVCVTGVSGSGKSTLINDILAKHLFNYFNKTRKSAGSVEEIEGKELIDKMIVIDQSPIGRTPRSNPASYVGFFTDIRDLYSSTNESKMRGYKPGRFSFNVKGGRCEECKGDGMKKIEMQFLPDVYVTCDVCKGKRYNREALEIDWKGKNIYDVLQMTVEEGLEFFDAQRRIKKYLEVLNNVGLGYIRLGQAATTLSGGEAQRIKLATELSRRDTGKTLYILDEPTTGLHFADVDKLLQVLHSLVEKGNTVLVIEHNLDVIKTADWIIDLGPEGGDKGGTLVYQGDIQGIVKEKNSYTGQYLKKYSK